MTSKYSVATPADWTKEDDVIVSTSISTEDAKLNFSKGVREIKLYLRYTPVPENECSLK